MPAGSLFALALALVMTCRTLTEATSSTFAVPGTSAIEVNSSVSYSDSSLYYPHPNYPDCDSRYALSWIGDGRCYSSLNVEKCGWDGGDCCLCTCNSTAPYGCRYLYKDYYCEDPSAPLDLADIGCHKVIFQPPEGGRCPKDQVYRVVNNADDATTLAEETVCSGGNFEVEWRGPVDVNTTIHVLNGTRLHIIGFSDAVADGGGIVQIFFVYNGSLYLDNIGIINGAESEGGAIILDAESELFADGVSFSSNTATNMGGAVYYVSSSIVLISTTFDGNSARNGGAMFVHDSVVVGSGNTTFIGNSVTENGGALYITQSSHIWWNMQLNKPMIDFPSYWPSSYNSSWYGYYAYWTMIDESGETNFLNNSAGGGSGGAMYADNSEISWMGTALLKRNNAWSGGALYLENGATVTSEGVTTFASNDALFDRGAIGATGDGGYLYVNCTTIVTNNTSGGNGGAIDFTNIYFHTEGDLSFSYNSAASFGGALYASLRSFGPTLIGVTFSGNIAEYGGAVYFSTVGTYTSDYYDSTSSNYGKSKFYGCRFDGNSASSTGGALYSAAVSDFVLNTTFVKNWADIGGGMSVSGTAYLSNISFEDNTSESS